MTLVLAILTAFIDTYLRVPRDEIQRSATSRDWILTRLRNETAAKSSEPQLYASEPTVPYGSYFKRTNVGAVDEFDLLVVLDANTAYAERNGAHIASGLGSLDPNPLFGGAVSDAWGRVRPELLVSWLHRTASSITAAAGMETPKPTPQSVEIRIQSSDVTVELVPAVPLQAGLERFYWMPGADGTSWLQTSPRDDIKRLADVAQGREGVRRLIRLAKYVSREKNTGLPSFAVETCIVDGLEDGSLIWSDDLVADAMSVLTHLWHRVSTGFIGDPSQPGRNLIPVGTSSGAGIAFLLAASAIRSASTEPDQDTAVKTMLEAFGTI